MYDQGHGSPQMLFFVSIFFYVSTGGEVMLNSCPEGQYYDFALYGLHSTRLLRVFLFRLDNTCHGPCSLRIVILHNALYPTYLNKILRRHTYPRIWKLVRHLVISNYHSHSMSPSTGKHPRRIFDAHKVNTPRSFIGSLDRMTEKSKCCFPIQYPL